VGPIQVRPRSRGRVVDGRAVLPERLEGFPQPGELCLGEAGSDVAGVQQLSVAVAADQDCAEVGPGRLGVADDDEARVLPDESLEPQRCASDEYRAPFQIIP
jgi:hypothetical protein